VKLGRQATADDDRWRGVVDGSRAAAGVVRSAAAREAYDQAEADLDLVVLGLRGSSAEASNSPHVAFIMGARI